MGKVFRFSQSLRFGHCDMAGIVFLSPFFDMVNATVEDWFERGLEFPFHDFHLKHRYGNPIVSTSCEFLHPCRYGEKMTLELGVASLGRSSIDLQISARVLGEERMRVRHKTAMISLGTFRSIAIPGELRAKMEQYAVVRGGAAELHVQRRGEADAPGAHCVSPGSSSASRGGMDRTPSSVATRKSRRLKVTIASARAVTARART